MVIDGVTNKVVSDIDLTYKLGDENVTVLKNTRVLNKVEPTILPTGNSNGVNNSSADYNEYNQRATISIGVSYNSLDDYPFEVGKKVMIEGVSVGVGSTGKGYNSANYEYKLFEILATDPNIGGTLGTITYSLAGVIPDGEIAGTYNSSSIGRVIREEDFPTFSNEEIAEITKDEARRASKSEVTSIKIEAQPPFLYPPQDAILDQLRSRWL